jgi:hypothetical protein
VTEGSRREGGGGLVVGRGRGGKRGSVIGARRKWDRQRLHRARTPSKLWGRRCRRCGGREGRREGGREATMSLPLYYNLSPLSPFPVLGEWGLGLNLHPKPSTLSGARGMVSYSYPRKDIWVVVAVLSAEEREGEWERGEERGATFVGCQYVFCARKAPRGAGGPAGVTLKL